MKTLTLLVLEKMLNALSKDIDVREKYAELVFDMLTKAYAYIGGLAGGKTLEEFKKNYLYDTKISMWKLSRRGQKITACRIYKGSKGGRKSVCIASDGSKQGRKDLTRMMLEDYRLTERKAWAEVSGKAFGAALKNGAMVIPFDVALELLKGDELTPMEDGFFYRRLIKGKVYTKVIIGNPPVGEGVQLDSLLIAHLKELSKKYEMEDEKRNGE